MKAVGAVVIRHLGPVKSPRADIVGLREGTDPLSTVGWESKKGLKAQGSVDDHT